MRANLAALLQLPIGAEGDYQGVIDLVKMKALIWQGEDLGASWEEVDIPAEAEMSALLTRLALVADELEKEYPALASMLRDGAERRLWWGALHLGQRLSSEYLPFDAGHC